MDISLLGSLPPDKLAIRERFAKSLDYFVKMQAKALGLPVTDLKQALPEMAFFDELSDGTVNSSTLGAYNHSQHKLKLNADAVLSGHTSVEMIVFHEYTHALDGLLVWCYIEPSEYLSWLKKHIVNTEMLWYNRLYPVITNDIEFVSRPKWSLNQIKVARDLMAQILEEPDLFFESTNWHEPIKMKSLMFNKIYIGRLACLAEIEIVAKYFEALYMFYLYSAGTIISPRFNDLQKAATLKLASIVNPKFKALAQRRQRSEVSLNYGSFAMHFGMKAYKVESYFDLPEAIQIGYLCAEGEIRARREASKLLLSAIMEWMEQNSPTHAVRNQLTQEIHTLKSSIQLEQLLCQWMNLKEYTEPNLFHLSSKREVLEKKIQHLAIHARTHKLTQSFYPNRESYQICREWNEKRILPYPDHIIERFQTLDSDLPRRKLVLSCTKL